jgi:hypothetical protein
MRLLIDECLPRALKRLLIADHTPEILSAKITKRLPDYQSMVKHVLADASTWE